MTVVTGAVNVTVRVDGVGRGPQKVDETRKAIDKIERSSSNAGGAVGVLRGRIDSLKEGVGPVNLLREGFEWLNSNIGFVGIAAGALVGVFGALSSALSTTKIDSVTQSFIRMAQGAQRARTGIINLATVASSLRADLTTSAEIDAGEMEAQALENVGRFEEAEKKRREVAQKRVMQTQVEIETGKSKAIFDARMADEQRKRAQVALADNQREIDHYNLLIRQRERAGLSTEYQRKQLAAASVTQQDLSANLAIADRAYRDNAKAVDLYNRKLEASNRLLGSLDQPAAKRPSGGGGARRGGPVKGKPEDDTNRLLGGLAAASDRRWEMEARQLDELERKAREERLAQEDERKAREDRAGAVRGPISSSRADDIRDFSAALSESLPGLAEWSGALKEVAGSWGDVAAANDDATAKYEDYLNGRATEAEYLKAMGDARKAEARGAIASVGAIATAGAESIKNERVRAGVLATIHLGLGTALMFVPGAQQEALGHLAGAAILGSVAIFGGSRGSGSSSSSSRERSVARQLSDRTSSGAVTLNIFGGWFGTSHPQETAAALHSMIARGGSGGYVPLPRAA